MTTIPAFIGGLGIIEMIIIGGVLALLAGVPILIVVIVSRMTSKAGNDQG